MMKWHQIFGMALTDYFSGSAYTVEVERDLSLRRQLLDIIIVERGDGDRPDELPDGFDNLAAHNLVTFKSHRETLGGWALDELVGHYVNYRKQVCAPSEPMPPEADFRLYGICARMPRKLMGRASVTAAGEGIYDVRWGIRVIRLIVLTRVPREDRNALWHLFGATEEGLRFGAARHRWRTPDVSTLVYELYQRYRTEDMIMPYTLEDYKRYMKKEVLGWLTAEERLRGLSPEEVFKSFSPEEIEEYLRKLRSKKRDN